MPKVNKDTTVCISIAKRPGNFGATVFNAAFEAMDLNFIYKPFQLDEEKLEDAIKGMKALGIRGCGVSMPHKINVLPHLDEIDPTAKKIGAVNTIVNTDGVLKGYNTDFLGAKKAIEEKFDLSNKKVLIIGAGGVARAIIAAAQALGAATIQLANRDAEKAKKLTQAFGIDCIPIKSLTPCDLLINATSVGMAPHTDEMIVDEEKLLSCEAVMDVVNLPMETELLKKAGQLGKEVIPGYQMTLHQAAAQFELYTGQKAPLELMKISLANHQKIK